MDFFNFLRLVRSTGGNRSLQVRTEDDYWSEDYDQSKNCAQGDRIAELRAKVYLYQRLIVCIANILASASPKDLGLKGKRSVKEPTVG